MTSTIKTNPMPQDACIFLAGHRGMVGSALLRALQAKGYQHVITRTHSELDLENQQAVNAFFEQEKPDYVLLAAAKVGGIGANDTYPADFIYNNLIIESNVIHASWQHKVRRLLFLGSSCIYPRLAPQPMPEEALLTGLLEPTNEPYAVAKIAGIKLCESYNRQYGTDFRSVMPTNLYGPHDNYDLNNSHVVPALIRKFHEAKMNGESSVTVWGSGNPRREFLHVDDMASASLFVMQLDKSAYETHTQSMLSHINVGAGEDLTIRELAESVQSVVGYEGEIVFDTGKPDGPPRKLLDVSRLHAMGWKAEISLQDGLLDAYRWFLQHQDSMRKS